jgi:hypothetical protein
MLNGAYFIGLNIGVVPLQAGIHNHRWRHIPRILLSAGITKRSVTGEFRLK